MYSQKVFEEQLSIGSKWADYVANYLNSKGVLCLATPMRVAQTKEEIQEFTLNDKDITFLEMPGNLEVKSRNLGFNNTVNSFPFHTAMVDTVSGWNQKSEKPIAVVCVSQVTKCLLVIPTETEHLWGQETQYDKLRGHSDTFYVVPKEHMKPITWLVDKLLEEQK